MIGIFDSGVGGLTVVKEIFSLLPDYEVVYFGDTARLPYGTKQAELIQKWSRDNVNWLIEQGAEIVIIACHTASSWAYDLLKDKAAKPLFDVVNPSIEEVIKVSRSKRIGVIGTPGTIQSGVYPRKMSKISPKAKVSLQACPLFVPIIEEGWMDKPGTKEIAREYLTDLSKKRIDALVLGCTHYPLLINTIQSIIGSDIKIVDPARSLAEQIKNFLKDNPDIEKKIKKGKDHRFFFSSQPYHLELISQLCLGKKIKATVINRD